MQKPYPLARSQQSRRRPSPSHARRIDGDISRVCESRLDLANGVIESAIADWEMPARLKRLTLPNLIYTTCDLVDLSIYSFDDAKGHSMGIISLGDCPSPIDPGRSALSIHGLYVAMAHQKKGIGRELIQFAIAMGKQQGASGLLAKAHQRANVFYETCGFTRLLGEENDTTYPHRWWLRLSSSEVEW